jgi:hypothetical protein
LYSQKIEIIDNDTVFWSIDTADYIQKINYNKNVYLWAYYDLTNCSDFFLSKISSEKSNSFIDYFEKNNIKIYNLLKSTDGYLEERCDNCKCPNGQRINFKIQKKDYKKILQLMKGTINSGYFHCY